MAADQAPPAAVAAAVAAAAAAKAAAASGAAAVANNDINVADDVDTNEAASTVGSLSELRSPAVPPCPKVEAAALLALYIRLGLEERTSRILAADSAGAAATAGAPAVVATAAEAAPDGRQQADTNTGHRRSLRPAGPLRSAAATSHRTNANPLSEPSAAFATHDQQPWQARDLRNAVDKLRVWARHAYVASSFSSASGRNATAALQELRSLTGPLNVEGLRRAVKDALAVELTVSEASALLGGVLAPGANKGSGVDSRGDGGFGGINDPHDNSVNRNLPDSAAAALRGSSGSDIVRFFRLLARNEQWRETRKRRRQEATPKLAATRIAGTAMAAMAAVNQAPEHSLSDIEAALRLLLAALASDHPATGGGGTASAAVKLAMFRGPRDLEAGEFRTLLLQAWGISLRRRQLRALVRFLASPAFEEPQAIVPILPQTAALRASKPEVGIIRANLATAAAVAGMGPRQSAAAPERRLPEGAVSTTAFLALAHRALAAGPGLLLEWEARQREEAEEEEGARIVAEAAGGAPTLHGSSPGGVGDVATHRSRQSFLPSIGTGKRFAAKSAAATTLAGALALSLTNLRHLLAAYALPPLPRSDCTGPGATLKVAAATPQEDSRERASSYISCGISGVVSGSRRGMSRASLVDGEAFWCAVCSALATATARSGEGEGPSGAGVNNVNHGGNGSGGGGGGTVTPAVRAYLNALADESGAVPLTTFCRLLRQCLGCHVGPTGTVVALSAPSVGAIIHCGVGAGSAGGSGGGGGASEAGPSVDRRIWLQRMARIRAVGAAALLRWSVRQRPCGAGATVAAAEAAVGAATAAAAAATAVGATELARLEKVHEGGGSGASSRKPCCSCRGCAPFAWAMSRQTRAEALQRAVAE
ncbi:unnamed protein product [Phaeothamnion confervicola]